MHELPDGGVNLGGQPVELPVYRVFLTVPQGTPGLHGPLNAHRRNDLAREVTDLVLAAEGVADIAANGHRVWCMLREHADGFWGVSGRIYPMSDIAAAARAGEALVSPTTALGS